MKAVTGSGEAMNVVFVAVASRIALLALMTLASDLLPTHGADGVHLYRPVDYPVPAGPGVGGPLAAFTRWDSAWLLSIAENGYPTASRSGAQSPVAEVNCSGTNRSWGDGAYSSGEQGEAQGAGNCRPDIALEEQAHAFFPLYPWLVRAVGKGISYICGELLGVGECLILAGVLISNASFVVAAVLLYRLGVVVLGDTLLAFRGALAFCVSPASVFFSSAYCESLFAALTFGGLLVLLDARRKSHTKAVHGRKPQRSWAGSVRAWIAAGLLAAATLTRSNGIAAAGVIVLEKLRWMADEAGLFSMTGSTTTGTIKGVVTRSASKKRQQATMDQVSCDIRWRELPWVRLVSSAIATGLQALLVVLPYIFVQVYAYHKFCGEDEEDGRTVVDADLLAELHPWCKWRVPSLYAYVQSAYWGVGAFKYYKWKQIPNFLLAGPALILTACGTARFFTAQLQREVRESGVGVCGADDGRSTEQATKRWSLSAWLSRVARTFFGPRGLPHPASHPFTRGAAAALVLQWGFLAAFAAVFMNVQVATRFLAASCPPLHWWTATLVFPGSTYVGPGNTSHSLRWYLALYFIAGAVLHPNFLPWT